MVSKNNRIKKFEQASEKKSRFGIRTLSVGTASVLLGTVFWISGNIGTAHAATVSDKTDATTDVNKESLQSEDSNLTASEDLGEISVNKKAEVLKIETPQSTATSAATSQAQSEIENSESVSVNSESISSASDVSQTSQASSTILPVSQASTETSSSEASSVDHPLVSTSSSAVGASQASDSSVVSQASSASSNSAQVLSTAKNPVKALNRNTIKPKFSLKNTFLTGKNKLNSFINNTRTKVSGAISNFKNLFGKKKNNESISQDATAQPNNTTEKKPTILETVKGMGISNSQSKDLSKDSLDQFKKNPFSFVPKLVSNITNLAGAAIQDEKNKLGKGTLLKIDSNQLQTIGKMIGSTITDPAVQGMVADAVTGNTVKLAADALSYAPKLVSNAVTVGHYLLKNNTHMNDDDLTTFEGILGSAITNTGIQNIAIDAIKGNTAQLVKDAVSYAPNLINNVVNAGHYLIKGNSASNEKITALENIVGSALSNSGLQNIVKDAVKGNTAQLVKDTVSSAPNLIHNALNFGHYLFGKNQVKAAF